MKTILFQGDSITDCGRNRERQDTPNDLQALGNGYAARAGVELLATYPSAGLRIFNRGISGNRVVDLYARWKADGVNLEPDLLSILIGVNDSWHESNSRNGVEPKRYGKVYRMLLDYTREKLPNVRLVLCEPFVLPCGAGKEGWVADIGERRQIVKSLAEEFGAVFVPFQSMFDEAIREAPPEYWAGDGVHPTPAGHARMARLWLERVGTI
jgi:lysophospholipase L1-like esterase